MRATPTHIAPDVAGAIAAATPARRRRLFSELVDSGRFCRDTPLGGILHGRSVSLREITDGDSLHVCVDESGRMSVHVDRFSPVAGACPDGRCRYSLRAAVAHVVAHVAAQLRRLATGARGRHRCRLECELVEVDEAAPVRCHPSGQEWAELEPAGPAPLQLVMGCGAGAGEGEGCSHHQAG
ncbi:MAG: hypothetical protein ACRD0N_04620 [Acidimicrobiales bacterium]